MYKCIAIIPARGGSKGVPKKNIRLLAGKPLIAHTIEAAKQAKCIDRIVVSTDSSEIADISRQCGAETPFVRPAELAGDTTSSLPVAQHAVNWLAVNENYLPDIVVFLQPVVPLRLAEDIENTVEKLVNTKADSVIGLCPVEGNNNPYWMRTLDGDRVAHLMNDSEEYTRRQDLPTVYKINGAMTVVWRKILMVENSFYGTDTRGYVMPEDRSVDIDNIIDFKVAEFLMSRETG